MSGPFTEEPGYAGAFVDPRIFSRPPRKEETMTNTRHEDLQADYAMESINQAEDTVGRHPAEAQVYATVAMAHAVLEVADRMRYEVAEQLAEMKAIRVALEELASATPAWLKS